MPLARSVLAANRWLGGDFCTGDCGKNERLLQIKAAVPTINRVYYAKRKNRPKIKSGHLMIFMRRFWRLPRRPLLATGR
jgi:hypothetical protein